MNPMENFTVQGQSVRYEVSSAHRELAKSLIRYSPSRVEGLTSICVVVPGLDEPIGLGAYPTVDDIETWSPEDRKTRLDWEASMLDRNIEEIAAFLAFGEKSPAEKTPEDLAREVLSFSDVDYDPNHGETFCDVVARVPGTKVEILFGSFGVSRKNKEAAAAKKARVCGEHLQEFTALFAYARKMFPRHEMTT